jgi:two-component system NtrC family sensor kinase
MNAIGLTGEGIFGVDKNMRFTFINPAAASILKYSQEEIQGMEVGSFLSHSEGDEHPIPPH